MLMLTERGCSSPADEGIRHRITQLLVSTKEIGVVVGGKACWRKELWKELVIVVVVVADQVVSSSTSNHEVCLFLLRTTTTAISSLFIPSSILPDSSLRR